MNVTMQQKLNIYKLCNVSSPATNQKGCIHVSNGLQCKCLLSVLILCDVVSTLIRLYLQTRNKSYDLKYCSTLKIT